MVRGLTEAGHEASHAVDGAYGLLEAPEAAATTSMSSTG